MFIDISCLNKKKSLVVSYPQFTVPVLFLANKNNAIYGVKISCVGLYQGQIEDFLKRGSYE